MRSQNNIWDIFNQFTTRCTGYAQEQEDQIWICQKIKELSQYGEKLLVSNVSLCGFLSKLGEVADS